MSQTQSQHIQRIASGDLRAIEYLAEEEAAYNDVALVNPLIQAIEASPTEALLTKAARCLVAISARGNDATFPTVIKFFVSKNQNVCCSHNWTDPQSINVAKFHANNLLSVVKSQPAKSCQSAGAAMLEMYLCVCLYSLRQLTPDAALALQTNVFQRFDHILSAMFRSLNKDHQLAWLGSLGQQAATPETAIGAFHAMCGMLREVHLCDADTMEILSSMLLWLPGMAKYIGLSSVVRRCVAGFATKLPDTFWVASLNDCSEQPPFSKWWHVSYRTCHTLLPSHDVMALIIASFQVEQITSLERVTALWRSIFYFTPPPKQDVFRREIIQWMTLIDDDMLCEKIRSAFILPAAPSNPSSSSLVCRMDRATQFIRERADLSSLSVYAAVAACVCPLYLAEVLQQLPLAAGDHSVLFNFVVDTMSSNISSHPSFAFTFYEAMLQYAQRGGKLTPREDVKMAAIAALSTANPSAAPVVPPSPLEAARRTREADLEPINEMLSRIEDVIRGADNNPEVRASIKERLKSILQRA